MSDDRLTRLVATAVAAGTPVAVVGTGRSADELRAALPTAGGRPATVVEMTGTADGLAEALEAAADLGTVVLAGPAPTEDPTLDLYADLHVRGLTITGAESSEP